jgi:hypothetical protein
MSTISGRILLVSAGFAGAAMLALGAGLVAAANGWAPFDVDADTTCADGSPVRFLERAADPTRVVLYFEGGGACFSAETCAFDGPETSYISASLVTPEWLAERGGIFDATNPQNPLADHSFVYVPYCTGDAHLGNRSTEYAADLTVEHRGFINGMAALEHLVSSYPDTAELVVAGMSGGAVPTPLYAALAADLLPEARIVALGDGSGAFPSDPLLNAYIGSLWGTQDAVPDWPETADLDPRDWGIPDLYRYAGQHAPEVAFARLDFAYDETQAFYGSLVGVPSDELLGLIEQNEADIEADGVEVASYIAGGSSHTILGSDGLYELEVEGVRLVDWLSDLVGGVTPDDVRCVDCS